MPPLRAFRSLLPLVMDPPIAPARIGGRPVGVTVERNRQEFNFLNY